jgi:hypothetical protein
MEFRPSWCCHTSLGRREYHGTVTLACVWAWTQPQLRIVRLPILRQVPGKRVGVEKPTDSEADKRVREALDPMLEDARGRCAGSSSGRGRSHARCWANIRQSPDQMRRSAVPHRGHWANCAVCVAVSEMHHTSEATSARCVFGLLRHSAGVTIFGYPRRATSRARLCRCEKMRETGNNIDKQAAFWLAHGHALAAATSSGFACTAAMSSANVARSAGVAPLLRPPPRPGSEAQATDARSRAVRPGHQPEEIPCLQRR